MRWGHANLLCIVPSLTDACRASPMWVNAPLDYISPLRCLPQWLVAHGSAHHGPPSAALAPPRSSRPRLAAPHPAAARTPPQDLLAPPPPSPSAKHAPPLTPSTLPPASPPPRPPPPARAASLVLGSRLAALGTTASQHASRRPSDAALKQAGWHCQRRRWLRGCAAGLCSHSPFGCHAERRPA